MKTLSILFATGLLIYAQSTRPVDFSWQPSPSQGVTGYNVYLGQMASDCTGTITKNNMTPIVGTSYTGVPLSFGQWCAAASALDGSGNESPLSPKIAFNVPPRTPILSCAGAICTWTDTNPATVSYKVWGLAGACPTSGVPAGATQLTASPITVKTFTVATLGTTCVYVTSYLKTPAGDLDGAPSNTAAAIVPPQPPGAPSVTLQIAGTFQAQDGTQVAFNSITLTLGK